MTLTADRPRASQADARRDSHRWVIPTAIIVAVALRLPFVNASPSSDEAGFLLVGAHWHSGGSSLYGNYWVDRPPLLIGIFQLASLLGGLPALRLIGCLAVGVIVLGSSLAARQIAGQRAARWAAICAAALCTTPLLGTTAVNGELLASPFVIIGVVGTIGALRADDPKRARVFALVAGVSGMCAMLVKQNFVDVFVFAVVAVAIAALRRDITARRVLTLIGSALLGAVLLAGAMTLITALHGTSIRGVFDAMYPFRLHASNTLAAGGNEKAHLRLHIMVVAWAASGMAFLTAAAAWGLLSGRLKSPFGWALATMLAFDIFSIVSGGSYWTHYLIQAIAPISIISGVVIARRQPLGRPVVALVAVASLVSTVIWLNALERPTGSLVGRAIAASASRGDTIVTAYGHADVVQSSGLPSPYRYLWSLPIKTLDPQLTGLNRVLAGPRAPTWLVVWRRLSSWGLDSAQVRSTVARNFHQVATLCGRTVYLRNGVDRPRLRLPATCPHESVVKTITKDELP